MKQFIIFTLLLVPIFFQSCGIGHPPFDSEKPDSENNKYHYEHLLNVKITPDVKNLYTYGDDLGIDASYYVAFQCNKQTSIKIIEANEMKEDTEKGVGLYSGLELKWWNKNEIDTLPRFIYSNTDQTYFKYYWYNENSNQGYFLDFDL